MNDRSRKYTYEYVVPVRYQNLTQSADTRKRVIYAYVLYNAFQL